MSGYKPRASGGGGGGSPGLPVWTFQDALGGTPDSGKFTTNNDPFTNATQILFSTTTKAGSDLSTLFNDLPNVMLLLTDTEGKTIFAFCSNASSGIFNIVTATGGSLSGDYALSFAPVTPGLGAVLGNSGITPVSDGTVTPVTSVTTVSGIVTAAS